MKWLLSATIVFALSFQSTVARGASEKVLYAFQGGQDGAEPDAALLNLDGVLYGTTYNGGGAANCVQGCGTVFKVSKTGAETVLYAFKGGSDGAIPVAGLINVGGTLYGTTYNGGGSANCPQGCGTVFKVTTSGSVQRVYSFGGGGDGANPGARLVDVGGTLYGTTYQGGESGVGTVFRVTTTGAETVLYSFKTGTDGANPAAGLISDGGALFGTTEFGGIYDGGTVFQVTTAGVENVLYVFQGGTDGANPAAALIRVGSVFYGTTSAGGGSERWPAKFGQRYKWKPCLKAASMPRIRSNHGTTSTADA
jgi:uncharacterized repeat protein (TIGR03803 family)